MAGRSNRYNQNRPQQNGGSRADHREEGFGRNYVDRREEREIARREEIVIKIPTSKLLSLQPHLFHNKVVIAFVGACTKEEAQAWIAIFSESSHYKLIFRESLINSLYRIVVDETRDGGSKKSLLKKPYRKAGDRFATLNSYQSAFDPHNPLDFRYMISYGDHSQGLT